MTAKTRRLKVRVHDLAVSLQWSGSTLTVTEYTDGSTSKQAVIVINDPWDLALLREQLDKIEAYWRKRLELE